MRLSPLIWSLSCLVFCSVGVVFAQEEGESLREGSHVLRNGDTLEGLASQYLGTRDSWRSIWQRNPAIENPHFLRPGDKLILPFRQLPKNSAFVAKAANQVQHWRPPLKQESAAVNDVLRSNDQVETGKGSSAEIALPDDSVLRLNEESKIILELAKDSATTVEREQVELVVGQVDLEGRSKARDDADNGSSGVQLVFGPAKMVPTPSEDGKIATRARLEKKTAQLMVYEGSGAMSAGGEEVTVDEGMGTSAEEGEAPKPPEELLAAPKLEAPGDGDDMATPRPLFSWQKIADAASYTLEVCLDPECGEIEQVRKGLTELSWHPDVKLPKAKVYWRVTATSPSGLDGYPSATRPLNITSDEEDVRPPKVAFKVFGVHQAPRYGLNRHWILAPGAGFEALAEDAESGLDRWIPMLDGEEVSAERWASGPWDSGVSHEASFLAVDRAANRATLDPVPFKLDDKSPELSWGLENLGPRGTVSAPSEPSGKLPWNPSRRLLTVKDPHQFLPWRKQIWTVDRDPRQILIRPNRPVRVLVDGQTEVVLTPSRGLWVLAEDPISEQVQRLDYSLDLEVVRAGGWFSKKSSHLTLEMEAADPVKNQVRGFLKLETLGRAKVERETPPLDTSAPEASTDEGN